MAHTPLFAFRFDVEFHAAPLTGGDALAAPATAGAFAECSGLEASMEPKTIREGGNNDTPIQRAGTVSYATVILKRGLARDAELWRWFESSARGHYARRMDCLITLRDENGAAVHAWKLLRALPVKFKTADFSARASDIGVEELHLVHEGLSLL